MHRLEEGGVGSGMGLSLIVGHCPLAEDSAAKLKRNQLNVCTDRVFCVRCTLLTPAAEICARLASNFSQ
jgi:hypothetical protein